MIMISCQFFNKYFPFGAELWDTLYLKLTSSIKDMVPLTCTTPICSLCKEGWALILKPAEYFATNFLNLFGLCEGFLAVSWLGGVIPCGGSLTSTLNTYKKIKRTVTNLLKKYKEHYISILKIYYLTEIILFWISHLKN